MWKVTLKGIWAKKVRFLLTGIAVMLGVAFISGTFVLTATISNTFDGLFSDIYQHTDAVVRAKETFSANFGGGRGTISASLLPTVKGANGVDKADGQVQGLAIIVDKKGDALGSNGQGAPTFGFAYAPDRELSTIHVVQGHGPRAPDDVVIDKKSADDAGYKPGDTVPVVTKAGRNDYHLTGIVKFGSADSPLGATIAAFTPATASRVIGTPGQFDSIDVKADPGVSQDQVVANIRTALKGAPDTANVEVISGKDITKESQNNLKDNLSFFNTFLLIFGVVALLVGSFIIFNTFSIIVGALRSRPGGDRRLDRRVRGRHLPRHRAEGAARRAGSRHPREHDRHPRRRGDLVVRGRVARHGRGRDLPGAARLAHRAGRGHARLGH
jgi:putative ABC transport system permease protein